MLETRLLGRGTFERLLDALDAAMEVLAEHPTRVSRPMAFPFPPKGQMYSFHHDYEGVRYDFNVFFWYMADEQTLKVFAITVL